MFFPTSEEYFQFPIRPSLPTFYGGERWANNFWMAPGWVTLSVNNTAVNSCKANLKSQSATMEPAGVLLACI